MERKRVKLLWNDPILFHGTDSTNNSNDKSQGSENGLYVIPTK